jgi:hypothetical protein
MKGAGMRIIGLDIHRAFAETVAWENGKLKRLGRVDMRRDRLAAFASSLPANDVVVVEATGNAAAIAEVIGPHVKRVVIANPKQVRIIAHAKIKTDTIDASLPGACHELACLSCSVVRKKCLRYQQRREAARHLLDIFWSHKMRAGEMLIRGPAKTEFMLDRQWHAKDFDAGLQICQPPSLDRNSMSARHRSKSQS